MTYRSTNFFFIFVMSFLAAQLHALPSEEEIKGVQILCGAGNVESAVVKGNVDAAIKSWRDASAGINVEVAKKNLTGALSQLKEDKYQEPMYKLYITCVSDTLQKYIDTESKKPKEIRASGTSSVLLRSAYATNEAIFQAGCDEAKDSAIIQLETLCVNGSITNKKITCPDVKGSPRTYTALITAFCTPQ